MINCPEEFIEFREEDFVYNWVRAVFVLIDLIFLPPIAEVDDSYILQKGQPYRYPPHLVVPSLPIRNASLSILNSSQTTPRVSSHTSRLLLVSSPCMSLDFSMFEVIRKPLTTSATYNMPYLNAGDDMGRGRGAEGFSVPYWSTY